MRIGAPRLAIEPGEPFVAVGARLFAIVAADAQILVDQQHVGRFADAVVDEEFGGFRIHVDDGRETMLAALDEGVDVLPRGHVAPRAFEQSGLGRHQPREGIAVEPDHLRPDRRANGGGARRPRDQRHFPDIAARGEIGEEDILPPDLLLDDHRSDADDIDVVAGIAFVEDRLARLHRQDLGGIEHFGDIGRIEPRAEHLEQLPLGRDARDRALGRRVGRHEFQRRGARHLDHDRRLAGADRRAAPPAGDQPDLAEDRPLVDRHLDAGRDLDQRPPARHPEQGRAGRVLLEDHLARAIGAHLAVEHELAHLQRR